MDEPNWKQFFKDTKEYLSKNGSFIIALGFVLFFMLPFIVPILDKWQMLPCQKEHNRIYKLQEELENLQTEMEESTDYMTLYCMTINYRSKDCIELLKVLNENDKDWAYRRSLLLKEKMNRFQ